MTTEPIPTNLAIESATWNDACPRDLQQKHLEDDPKNCNKAELDRKTGKRSLLT